MLSSAKRRSVLTPGDQTPASKSGDNVESPEDDSVSDDVVKRSKTGPGLGGDVLAEMKSKQEKRASVIPTKSSSDLSTSKEDKDSKEPENPFGGIKLR